MTLNGLTPAEVANINIELGQNRYESYKAKCKSQEKGRKSIMTKKGIEGNWDNNSLDREMLIDLFSTRDSTLIGAVGELIVWKYLKREEISVYRFGSTYFPGIHEKQADLSDFFSGYLKWLNKQQVDYLKNIYRYETRRWDFIGRRYRYKSRYGRRRIEQVTFELRETHNKKEEDSGNSSGDELTC